jgi:ribosome-associated heat shock protein Hsp15
VTSDRAGVRLDRWLWAARFYKTRSQASYAVKAGRVDSNGHRAKPSQTVRVGSQLAVRKGPYEFSVTVLGLAERRGSAEIARALFQEDPKSIERREQVRARIAAESTRPLGSRIGARPTKRQRRQLDSFLDQFYFGEEFDEDGDEERVISVTFVSRLGLVPKTIDGSLRLPDRTRVFIRPSSI